MSRRVHMQTADKLIQSHTSGRWRRMCHRWRPWETMTEDASAVTCPRCIKLLAEQVSEVLEDDKPLTIDGVVVEPGSKLWCTNQKEAKENGVYVVTSIENDAEMR